MNNKFKKEGFDEKKVERYATFYQKLSEAYDKKEDLMLKKENSFFHSLEEEASNFTPDELEVKLLNFIAEKHDFYAGKRSQKIVLFEESIDYDNYNPYKLIRTAFRVYLPKLTWIKFVLEELNEMADKNKDLLFCLLNFLSLILSVIVYLIWIVLAGHGSVCLFGSEIDLFFYLITAFYSMVVGYIASIGILFLMFILTKIFEKAEIKNRRKIKLPELRLLFAELEAIKLMPKIIIEIDEEFKDIHVTLTIDLNNKLIAKIAKS